MAETERGRDKYTGTREEVVTELEERALGKYLMGGSDASVDRVLEAAQGVRSGADSAQTASTDFTVTEQNDIPATRSPGDKNADSTDSRA
ncbi:hypothetical protein [Streptomyces katsurahamanus]|uniref:Uncharacterized protein n=1 Tax=Streptomyces katsurahamanus TaxID=2577098 RepID=A0ABW9P1B0_9ACTN|nr:hypothetical protein [Streptomyces katsurahamanus]MQS39209.1 hypothetical protein [Streptomyces katsurahamanus]